MLLLSAAGIYVRIIRVESDSAHLIMTYIKWLLKSLYDVYIRTLKKKRMTWHTTILNDIYFRKLKKIYLEWITIGMKLRSVVKQPLCSAPCVYSGCFTAERNFINMVSHLGISYRLEAGVENSFWVTFRKLFKKNKKKRHANFLKWWKNTFLPEWK